MERRSFLAGGLGAAAAMALPAASQPILLGFDTYSLMRLGWKGTQLLDFAAAQKLDTIQFSSPGDYGSLEPAHLQKVKDHAARLGIVVESGANSICPTSSSWDKSNGDPVEYVRRCLRAAKAVGATIMRCYLGSGSDRRGTIPIEGHVESMLNTMRAVRSEALDLGVKFAVENHAGDLLAREMKTLLTEAGTDLAGACLDTGNPVWMAEDPLLTMEILGPYAITTHVRDSVVFEHPRGAAVQWVALGDGSIDLQQLMALYRKLCPKAAFQHEVITGSGPRVLNYNEPEFWQVYPKMPAADFARFLNLARKGHPLMAPMLIPGRGANQPPEYEAAVRVQARVDLERSLEYSKKTLDVGVRWRG
ncbi:MAG: sugar phosphate isomerase/epimerase [Bryobacterales bacterium]|nr:sugar phosphate isomerase/epimerase [Bryobacterales bacterium]